MTDEEIWDAIAKKNEDEWTYEEEDFNLRMILNVEFESGRSKAIKEIIPSGQKIAIIEDCAHSFEAKLNGEDLDNGKFYSLRRKDKNQIETAITKGNVYDVEFVEVPNAKNLTGAEIENLNPTLGSIQFARVEDLDYRKGGGANGRELYFVATGVSGSPDKTYWGRMYRLKLDANSPLTGKLDIVADGADKPGSDLINPDNVCATENYVYIQEDGDSFFPGATHNSWICQYNIATGVKKPFMEMKNKDFGGTKYNPTSDMRFGLWEHGAMVDISDIIGVSGAFTINIHPHTWVENDKFLNQSKATSIQSYKSGGQTLIITNVPK